MMLILIFAINDVNSDFYDDVNSDFYDDVNFDFYDL